MEQPKWNEGRLDDLNKRVDDGIGRLDDERKELRGEIREGFAKIDRDIKDLRGEMNDGFAQVDGRLEKINDRFDGLQRTLIGAGAVILAAVIGPQIF